MRYFGGFFEKKRKNNASNFADSKKMSTFAHVKTKRRNFSAENPPKVFGEMAEWSIAAVLKTVEGHTSGGSNPSLSARSERTI